MNNYKVYVHTFPNGKYYVGITRQQPVKRWRYGNGYQHQPLIYNAIKKYGWHNIRHEILYDNLSKEDAEQKEVELITKLKSNNKRFGYNIANGGQTRGTFSEATKRKISQSRKGIVFSSNHLKKLSDSHKGLKPTKEQNYKNMINNPKRKPVECIETGIIYPSVREAGRKMNLNYKRICDICNGKYGRKTTRGYTFRYVKDGDA